MKLQLCLLVILSILHEIYPEPQVFKNKYTLQFLDNTRGKNIKPKSQDTQTRIDNAINQWNAISDMFTAKIHTIKSTVKTHENVVHELSNFEKELIHIFKETAKNGAPVSFEIYNSFETIIADLENEINKNNPNSLCNVELRNILATEWFSWKEEARACIERAITPTQNILEDVTILLNNIENKVQSLKLTGLMPVDAEHLKSEVDALIISHLKAQLTELPEKFDDILKDATHCSLNTLSKTEDTVSKIKNNYAICF